MKLTYSYKKWEKTQKRCGKDKWLSLTEKNLHNHIFAYTDPEGFAEKYKSMFPRPAIDKMTQYTFLSNDYHSFVEKYYLMGNNELCWESLYKYVIYKINAYKNYDPGSNHFSIKLDIQAGKRFNLLMCAAIITDEYDSIKDYAHFSPIIEAIFLHNDEKASGLIEKLPDSVDESKEVYYINNCYLKKIFTAILAKDEKEFNEAIKERITKLRKNMEGYLTVIDIISLGFIKLAMQRGVQYDLDVIEIPVSFIDDRADFKKSKPEIELF